MKKSICMLAVGLCLVGFIYSQEKGVSTSLLMEQLNRIFSEAVSAELVEKGEIKNIQYKEKDIQLHYYPRTSLGEMAATSWKSGEPVLTVEAVYLLKKTQPSSMGSDISVISEILRSISTLEGVEYYSNRRGKMHTLYEQSYVIDNEKSKKKIPDPVSGNANGLTLYAYQKDTTFGATVYQYTYAQTENEVAFFSHNVTAMKYMLFELVKAGNLKVSLVVTDIGSAIVSYALVQADFAGISAFENKLSTSFSARADAIYGWFVDQYIKKQ